MNNSLKKIIFSTCFCLYVFTVHAQYDSVFKVPYPKRYEAIYFLVQAGGDSAKDISRAVKLLDIARKSYSERDQLAVERVILVAEVEFKVDMPHIQQKAADLIKRAEQIDCYPIRAYVYGTLGDYYYHDLHDYVRAFRYFLLAYNDYHNLHKEEFPDMSWTQYSLALSYYKFYDYKNSLKYSKELFQNNLCKGVWLEVLVNDLIGMSYLKSQQYDSSIVYFQKTLELAPRHHDPISAIGWQGIATGNIGLAWYLQKNYDKAVPYLQKGEELSTKGAIPDNIASFAIALANIYIARGDMVTAQKQLQTAHDATWKANNLENYWELYPALSAFYRAKGNAVLTLQYEDSSLKFKDSLAAIADVNKMYGTEVAVADERNRMSERLAEKEKQKQILIRNGLLIITLMTMFFLLLFYNRKLLKQKHRREQILAEKQVTETELANAVQQLDNFKNNIAEKNDLIAALEKERANEQDTATLSSLRQSTILTDEQWGSFRLLFEKAHPGFLQKLKEKLPDLTPAEIRFMVLAKLNFTNKEMAGALGVSGQAIRTTWYRLRKKLNLPEEGSLEELVEKI